MNDFKPVELDVFVLASDRQLEEEDVVSKIMSAFADQTNIDIVISPISQTINQLNQTTQEQKNGEQVKTLMDEYAKQEAIAFAEWISGHEYSFNGDCWVRWEITSFHSREKIKRTTEQLYNLYLQSKSNKEV